ncbi:MAG TPA: DUF3563 family protein [Casimicrobiaceae bacterium]|jgi:hypothetical protein
MSSVQTWTPDRAEAYFTGSLIGQVSTWLADAITELSGHRRTNGGRPTRPGDNGHVERRAEPRAAKQPRQSFFARLEAKLWRAEQERREAWLAESTDVFDLERRMQRLDRGHPFV